MLVFSFLPINGNPYITWANSYKFDPEKEEITLFNEKNIRLKTYSFINDNLQRIDVYDCVPFNDGTPIQIFTKKP